MRLLTFPVRLKELRGFRGAMIGALCGLISWLSAASDVSVKVDQSALDALFQVRGARSTAAKICIVELDESSLEEISKPAVEMSPELARVVEHLNDAGAAAIGIDIIVPDASIDALGPQESGDAELMGMAVNESGKVVLAEHFGTTKAVEPAYVWQRIEKTWDDVGFINFTVDEDMCLRRQRLRATAPGGAETHPSFSLAVFAKARRLAPNWFAQRSLQVNDRTIPLHDGLMYVNFLGPPGSIPRIPFSAVLKAADGSGPSLEHQLQGAIVLVGGMHGGLLDMHSTPYTSSSLTTSLVPPSWLGFKPSLMQGIEVHANVVATLLDAAFIAPLSSAALLATLVAMGAALGVFLMRVNLEQGALAVIIHHFAWKVVCLVAFIYGDVFVPVAAMFLLGPLLYSVIFGLRWRWVRRMMGMFKSEEVAKALETDPRAFDLHGEERVITVLFSDVRGFTTYSEGRAPREVFSLLNAYFSAIVPILEAHGGVVDKYIGDGIMVLFGAPTHQPDHACRAVKAAVAMLRRVHELQPRWAEMGAEQFKIGIGVHSGTAITGTVGSRHRLDYTAIGDTVNTSSRIESATKDVGAELLVSEATFDFISAEDRRQFNFSTEPSTISVKGKQKAFNVYVVDVSSVQEMAGRSAS